MEAATFLNRLTHLHYIADLFIVFFMKHLGLVKNLILLTAVFFSFYSYTFSCN